MAAAVLNNGTKMAAGVTLCFCPKQSLENICANEARGLRLVTKSRLGLVKNNVCLKNDCFFNHVCHVTG